MEKPYKIGVYNHKGGVAKTTSVIQVTYYLQKMGHKILTVDCDSQRNCFSFLNAGNLTGKFHNTRYDGVSATTWDTYKNNIETEADFILFDLPPAMTEEVREIIRHCDTVFVPLVIGTFEIEGLADVTDEIHRQGTELGGVFTTMFKPKEDTDDFIELGSALKKRLMSTIIPQSATVRQSQKYELSLEEYFNFRRTPNVKSSRKIALAYEDLTAEMLGRCAV